MLRLGDINSYKLIMEGPRNRGDDHIAGDESSSRPYLMKKIGKIDIHSR